MHFGYVGLATTVLALSSGLASAHGSHSNESPSSDWATRHMQGEGEFVSIWDFPQFVVDLRNPKLITWFNRGTPHRLLRRRFLFCPSRL